MKEIEGFSGYFITESGDIYSNRRKWKGLCKKASYIRNGYETTNLRKYRSKSESFSVHRLVANHFLENPEKKPQVNHIDGNKLNNNISNLEWVTAKENHTHAIENGLACSVGERNKSSKVDWAIVLTIRTIPYSKSATNHNKNLKNSHISALYGITYSSIWRIRKGLSWSHLPL